MEITNLIQHPKIMGHAFFVPLIIQAAIFHPYYQNKPGFLLARRALTPIIILAVVKSVKNRIWEPLGECMMVNFPFTSLITFHAICLAVQFGLYDGPVFKREGGTKDREEEAKEKAKESKTDGSVADQPSEANPSVTSESMSLEKDARTSGTSVVPVKDGREPSRPTFGEMVRFVLWLMLSPRGLEFAWAPPQSVLTHRQPISTKDFVTENLARLFSMHLHGTICWTIAVHAFHHKDGIYGILTQSIGLPPSKALKFAAGYGLPFCLGASMWSGMEIASCAMNIFEAIIWPVARKVLPADLAPQDEFDPTRYPPLFSTPWARESMCEFWGKGWHSLFRRDLIFCASLPVSRVFKRFGKNFQQLVSMMAAMGLTAIMHEYAIASISRAPWDYEIVAFFMHCALVMLFEVLLARYTKYKIGGLFGYIWTYGWLMYLGKPGMDLWMERGLGEGMTPVSQWSWKRFVFPAGTLMPNEWLDVFLPF